MKSFAAETAKAPEAYKNKAGERKETSINQPIKAAAKADIVKKSMLTTS